jgi:hypothetical protein
VLSLNAAKPVNITTGGDNNQAGILNKRPAGIARNTEARVITVSLNSFNVLDSSELRQLHRNAIFAVFLASRSRPSLHAACNWTCNSSSSPVQ